MSTYKEDLEELIEVGGGSVLRSKEELESQRHDCKGDSSEELEWQRHDRVVVLQKNWSIVYIPASWDEWRHSEIIISVKLIPFSF